MILLDPADMGLAATRLLLDAETQASMLPSCDPEAQSPSTISDSVLADVAAQELRRRTRRSQHLPANLFGETAWELLLKLFVSEQSGQSMSLLDACAASQTSQATAVRYIVFMVAYGLVQRDQNQENQRKTAIRLTAKGRTAIRAALQEYARDVVAIIVD